ncbi:MAG: hypothetical protein PVI06_11490 [Desulfobacterales bacterium]
MSEMSCFFERISKLSIGIILALFGLGLVIISFTILPFFGLFLAAPVLLASGYFIRAHLNRECQIAE